MPTSSVTFAAPRRVARSSRSTRTSSASGTTAISIRSYLPNDTHRLQHHRQAPLQQRVQLPALQYQPRHAEQPRRAVSGISGRGESDFGALCVSNSFAPRSARHGQRSVGRLEWSAGHLLQRAYPRHVGRDVCRRSAAIGSSFPTTTGMDPATAPARPPVVAKRLNHADREHVHVAAR